MLKEFWRLLKKAGTEWAKDHATRLAAALAYYTMLSLAPLLVITIKIVSFWYRNTESAQNHVTSYLQQFVGSQSAAALQAMTQNALQPGSGIWATTVSFVLLLVSAGGVFGELQDSMNLVWNVKPKPGRPWKQILRQRFFSLTLVVGTAFILLVSLIVNTVVANLLQRLGAGWFWTIINSVLPLMIVTMLFALIFKWIPDVELSWKPAWHGALLTAILFVAGKYSLEWYLSHGSTISVYGAAGSLAALLIWTYYSGLILFFGAEFTQALATSDGGRPKPASHAMYRGKAANK